MTLGRDELWYPSEAVINIMPLASDEIRFLQDATLIRVSPISEVADGIFNGDLAFRLTMMTVSEVFGNSLDRFVRTAWEKYNSPSGNPDEFWRSYAFMTIYEVDKEKPDTTVPMFRGYLPMDERLLTVATSDFVME